MPTRQSPTSANLTRRQILAGGVALGAVGCGGARAGTDDPTYAGALPGPDKVDGKLSRLIPGKRRAALYTMDAPSAVKGAAVPLVTIVEFSDFQCPFCGTLASALGELASAYPDDVRIVFRQFPLGFHKQAEPAARAVLAAGRQKRFWVMHDLLFANRARLSDEALHEYAATVGLDRRQFDADLSDAAIVKRVKAETDAGRTLGVSGTPSMFINGFFVSGVLDPQKLTDVIDGERRVADALIEAGSKREEVYARFMRAAGAK